MSLFGDTPTDITTGLLERSTNQLRSSGCYNISISLYWKAQQTLIGTHCQDYKKKKGKEYTILSIANQQADRLDTLIGTFKGNEV